MAEFAALLQATILDRPAVDQTGLGSVKYDVPLKWTPVAAQSDGAESKSAGDNLDAPPDLFADSSCNRD
jgi:uncharacterized protein (TIGR03435 family)